MEFLIGTGFGERQVGKFGVHLNAEPVFVGFL